MCFVIKHDVLSLCIYSGLSEGVGSVAGSAAAEGYHPKPGRWLIADVFTGAFLLRGLEEAELNGRCSGTGFGADIAAAVDGRPCSVSASAICFDAEPNDTLETATTAASTSTTPFRLAERSA